MSVTIHVTFMTMLLNLRELSEYIQRRERVKNAVIDDPMYILIHRCPVCFKIGHVRYRWRDLDGNHGQVVLHSDLADTWQIIREPRKK